MNRRRTILKYALAMPLVWSAAPLAGLFIAAILAAAMNAIAAELNSLATTWRR